MPNEDAAQLIASAGTPAAASGALNWLKTIQGGLTTCLAIAGLLGTMTNWRCSFPAIAFVCTAPTTTSGETHIARLAVVEGITAKVVPPASFVAITPAAAVSRNIDYESIKVSVMYRPDRAEDAQRIVGILDAAGFSTRHAQGDLSNVIAENKSAGRILVKATAARAALNSIVRNYVLQVLPGKSGSDVAIAADTLAATPELIQQREIQVDLF